MRPVPCVVSVAEHTGWAHLVCVAAHGNVPAVIERRRVALIDQGLPTMPYEHDTTAMREDEANAVIAADRASVVALKGRKRMSHGRAWWRRSPAGYAASHVRLNRTSRAVDLKRTSEGRAIADVAQELGIGDWTFASTNH